MKEEAAKEILDIWVKAPDEPSLREIPLKEEPELLPQAAAARESKPVLSDWTHFVPDPARLERDTFPAEAILTSLVLSGPLILNDSEAVPIPPTWILNLDSELELLGLKKIEEEAVVEVDVRDT